MSGWGFSALKTEATENHWLFIQCPDNSSYVQANFIMIVQYVIPSLKSYLHTALYAM